MEKRFAMSDFIKMNENNEKTDLTKITLNTKQGAD